MEKYLQPSTYIDWEHPEILAKAKSLAGTTREKEEVARQCFLFVRDKIKHSYDYQLNPVTCKASDVLEHRTGYCYAKSHLLAALLRANNIPTGLCYQRLTNEDTPPFCLHGLNAIHLEQHGWYRVDARGNKEGVTAEFNPPIECLAYALTADGEQDLPKIYYEPLPTVLKVLTYSKTYNEVAGNLPDTDTI